MNHLRGNKIVSMKIVWGGPAGGSVTWEFESRMKESYLEFFPSDNFFGQNFYKWGRVVTP